MPANRAFRIRRRRPGIENGLISFIHFLPVLSRAARKDAEEKFRPRWASGLAWIGVLLLVAMAAAPAARAQDNDTCLACHSDKSLTTTRAGHTVSVFVDGKRFGGSIHGSLACINCHADLDGKELPHSTPLAKVNCGACHSAEYDQHSKSLHGRAVARGDSLAPRCVTCHGNHDIVPVKDPRSPVSPMKIPNTCGK